MRFSRFNAELFTPKRVRIGAGVLGVAAVALCAGLIGASTASSATQSSAQANPVAHGLLQIRFAAPEPIVLPPPPLSGEQLDVLADAPADLAADSDLQTSRDLATIRQADAVLAKDAAVQAALWAKEDAKVQAQIDEAMRPPLDAELAMAKAMPKSGDDPDITASAGDTRKLASPAE